MGDNSGSEHTEYTQQQLIRERKLAAQWEEECKKRTQQIRAFEKVIQERDLAISELSSKLRLTGS
eukprot:53762-Pyramimonas_sp.AAC.1